MALNPVLAAGFIMNILAAIFVIGSVVLILVILIQKGKGGGLSGAFAGGMASGILGSKTGDVLTWITISVASLFIIVALVLDKWWRPTASGPESQNSRSDYQHRHRQGHRQPARCACTGRPAGTDPAISILVAASGQFCLSAGDMCNEG